MNIRDLRYLVALAQTQHFGQAAAACHVSQPTLSAQLKKLEDELGVVLVERSNKSVRLTPIGEEIVAESRHVLHSIKRIKQLADSRKDPFAGPFHLGIIPTLAPYLLPHLVPLLLQHLPRVEFIVYENKTNQVLKALREGRLDAAIVALPVGVEGLQQVKLFDEPFYVLLPNAHPLAKRQSVSLADIQRETLLLLEEGHCLREQALEACHTPEAVGGYAYSATSLETLRHMVALGSGITLLPALAVESSEASAKVVVKRIADEVPARTIGMLWRQTAVNVACCQAIAKHLGDAMADLPQLQPTATLRPLQKPVG